MLVLLMGVSVLSQSSSALPKDLAQAAAGYDKAQWSADRVALQRYLADDYMLVNGAAELETKSQLIADFTDVAFKLNPYKVEKPMVRVWPGAAVLAGEASLTGTSSGKPFAAHTRFVDVWRLRGGKWQVAYTQVTRIPAAH